MTPGIVLSTKTIRTPFFCAAVSAAVTPTPIGEMTIAWAPLVTASWISAIWHGVSSFVLHALVVSSTWSGWSVAYFLAPAIIASQKPPVALVSNVTLIFSVDAGAEVLVAGALVLVAGAGVLATAGGLSGGGAPFPRPLPPLPGGPGHGAGA